MTTLSNYHRVAADLMKDITSGFLACNRDGMIYWYEISPRLCLIGDDWDQHGKVIWMLAIEPFKDDGWIDTLLEVKNG